MPKSRPNLAALSARPDADGVAPPDGMANYLGAMLAEAGDALETCVREPAVAADLRAALCGLADEVRALRVHLRWLAPDVAADLQGAPEPLPAITRAMVRDVERAALCRAFRERCGELASHLPDPDRTRAAVVELRTGLKLLGRALGARPLAA